MLVAIPVNFATGPIVKKIGVKNVFIIGLIIFIVTSVAPFFLRESFAPILVTRAINGLGYGLITPILPTLINTYVEPERRAQVLGYGQSVTQGFGIALSTVVGLVAARSVYNIWLLNLVMCIPLVLTLLLPKAPQWEEDAPAAEKAAKAAPAEKEKLGGVAWLIIIIGFLFFVFSYPAFLYLSPLIIGKGLGDAAMAGFVQTCFSIGGVIAGLIFGKLYGVTKKYVIPVGMLMLVFNYFIFAFTDIVPLYYVANLIGGIGYSIIYVGCITALAVNTTPTAFPVGMGIMVALMNCGAFVSPYVISGVAGAAGMAASITFPFLLCGVVFIIMAAALCIKPLNM